MKIARCLFFLMAVSPLQAESTLVWRNGDTLPGVVWASTPGEITWKSPVFSEPVTLERSVLQAIVSAVEVDPGDLPFLVEMQDGSRLFGTVFELNDQAVTLASPSLDRVRIPISRVRRVRPMRGKGLHWAGPYGKLGWRNLEGEPIADLSSWVENPANGALRFLQMSQPAEIPVELPEKLECRITLEAADQRPRFAATLRAAGSELQIETWGQTVVLRTGATAFQPLQKVGDGERRISLRIFWDTAARRGLVASEKGEILGRFDEIEPVEEAGSAGLWLRARCPDLVLRQVEIWRWDGVDPVGPGDSGTFAFEAETKKRATAWGLEVALADSGRFFGELVGINGPFALFRTGFCDEELRVRQANLRRVDLAGEVPEKRPPAESEGPRLTVGDDSLAGQWTPSGNAELLWRLEGARDPVRLAWESGDAALRLDRTPAGLEPLENVTLAFFRNGEIAPGRLRSMHEQGGEFRFESPLFDSGRFEQAWLRGVVFDSTVLSTSLESAQWASLGDGKVSFKESGFTIEPGSALGHPALIQAGRIHFHLPVAAAQKKQLGLRIRLFCDGLDPDSASTTVSLLFYRDRIQVLTEKQNGEFRSNGTFRLDKGMPATVELDWTGPETIVRSGGSSFELSGGPAGERSGLGVVLEPGYGRTTPTSVSVEKIRVAESPALTTLPYLGAKARDQALFVPRFREGNEPDHVLVARNGDALRGTVETFDGERFSFRSMLDSVTIPGERIAGLVSFGVRPPSQEGEGAEEKACWVVLRNGARFRLENPRFGEAWIEGRSALLGNCRLPAGQVRMFTSAEPEPNAAAEYLADFRLRAAPQPDPGGGGSGGSGDDSMAGEAAPEFTVDRLGGGEVSLSEFSGKVLVLSFWASWSEPGLRRIKDLIEVVSEFSENRVQFLAVNQGEPEAMVRQAAEVRDWKRLVIGIDRDRETMDAYGVEVLPTTVVIGRDGKIATFAAPGEVTAETIEAALGNSD